jgi:thioredoxin-related protein
MLVTTNVCAQTPSKTIPPFNFIRLNRTAFSNKGLQPGKKIFFCFFDAECEHCQRAIQYIGQHYLEFKKAAIYLITLDSVNIIKQFMNKYGAGLKDKNDVTILRDTRNEFISKFGPRKYPSLFLYSSKKELILYDDNEQNLFKFLQQIKIAGK